MHTPLKRLLVGSRLDSVEARHQRLGKAVALAVFSSDALSSVAYATEEIRLALTPAGVGALAFALPVALAIAGLIAAVVLANLRGVRESGRIFAIPTYAFLATLGFLVLLGLLALATEGRAGPPSLPSPGGTVSLFLILRAFAYLVL